MTMKKPWIFVFENHEKCVKNAKDHEFRKSKTMKKQKMTMNDHERAMNFVTK